MLLRVGDRVSDDDMALHVMFVELETETEEDCERETLAVGVLTLYRDGESVINIVTDLLLAPGEADRVIVAVSDGVRGDLVASSVGLFDRVTFSRGEEVLDHVTLPRDSEIEGERERLIVAELVAEAVPLTDRS